MKKKISYFLILALILVAAFYGIFEYTDYLNSDSYIVKQELTKPTVSEKYPEVQTVEEYWIECDQTKANKPGFNYEYSYIKPVAQINSKYILSFDYYAKAVSKEEFISYIDSVKEEYMVNDVELAMRDANYLIKNITNKNRQHDLDDGLPGKIYWSFCSWAGNYMDCWRTLTAFEDAIPIDSETAEFSYRYQGTDKMEGNILRNMGLSLNIENSKIEKMIFDDCSLTYVVEISADVTTEEKPEAFDKLAWIPEKGETNRVTFAMSYISQGNATNSNFITDIAVLDY